MIWEFVQKQHDEHIKIRLECIDFFKSKAEANELIDELVKMFCDLYKKCATTYAARERYARFLCAWLNALTVYINSENCINRNTTWGRCMQAFELHVGLAPFSANDASAVFHSIAHAIADTLRTSILTLAKTTCILRHGDDETTPTNLHEETEYSLLRIGGGCLAKLIHFLRAHSQGKWKKKKFYAEVLNLAKACTMTSAQKKQALLPTGLATRDKGYMWIPKRFFLTWLRRLNNAVCLVANKESFTQHGSELVKVTVAQVKASDHLRTCFVEAVNYSLRMEKAICSQEAIDTFFVMWQQKFVHARLNEFISSYMQIQAEKEGFSTTPGGFNLRDNLYGYVNVKSK
ncbi:PREDICTED: uncharacterized protein LOC106821342 [Priapulus caudatus]|uniref:Uncharacterized protein LOC106821342 n=1 Tax=Priapulus caudatus TaxID=37621 RepID=A0ABM1FAW3_PRICU|nr:PREDICTED: uncharacterized protein LOC106821342 [Priapulus caudatus]